MDRHPPYFFCHDFEDFTSIFPPELTQESTLIMSNTHTNDKCLRETGRWGAVFRPTTTRIKFKSQYIDRRLHRQTLTLSEVDVKRGQQNDSGLTSTRIFLSFPFICRFNSFTKKERVLDARTKERKEGEVFNSTTTLVLDTSRSRLIGFYH